MIEFFTRIPEPKDISVTESFEETLSEKKLKYVHIVSFAKPIFIIVKNQEMSNLSRLFEENETVLCRITPFKPLLSLAATAQSGIPQSLAIRLF